MSLGIRSICAVTVLVALNPSLAGCVSFRSLDLALDQAVGKHPDQISDLPLSRAKVLRSEGARITTAYEFSGAGRCRWEFVSDATSKVILSWRYPDDEARSRCQGLARTRP